MTSDWIVIVEPIDAESAERSFTKWTEENPVWFGLLGPQHIHKDVIRALDGSTLVRCRARPPGGLVPRSQPAACQGLEQAWRDKVLLEEPVAWRRLL